MKRLILFIGIFALACEDEHTVPTCDANIKEVTSRNTIIVDCGGELIEFRETKAYVYDSTGKVTASIEINIDNVIH